MKVRSLVAGSIVAISLVVPTFALAASTNSLLVSMLASIDAGYSYTPSNTNGGLFNTPDLTGSKGSYNTTAADAMCNPVHVECPCNTVLRCFAFGGCKCVGGDNKHDCPLYCKATIPGGVVLGHCTAPNVCHADVYTGLNGQQTGIDSGLSGLSQQLGQLFQQLMGGQGSGGSGGGGYTSPSGCTGSYYVTTTPSSDPCAQYQPDLLGSSSSTNDLSNLLGDLNGNSNTNTNSNGSNTDLLSSLTGSGDTSTQSTNTNQNTFNASGFNNTNSNAIPISNGQSSTTATSTIGVSGANGNIVVGPNGVTITANSSGGNSVTAGFYGAQSLVGSICANRPWASGFLSYIISPTFFDGICTKLGYQVGAASSANTSSGNTGGQATLTQQSFTSGTSGMQPPTGVNTIAPQVRIWASPTAVPLGARTSVFWSTQGVTRCTETSPDGSFSQNTLQGSGSTVPLTGPTTFTISCQAPDGTPVSDYVTVQIAI